MKDQNKTKKQLMDKLMALRKRVAELETFEADHTRAEEVLHESEKLYRSLFENMLNGFAYCQMHFDDNDRPSDFTYLSVNSAFETLTGLRNVVGKKVTEVIPGIREADPELLEIYGRVSKTGYYPWCGNSRPFLRSDRSAGRKGREGSTPSRPTEHKR